MDHFFQGQGIGAELLEFAKVKYSVNSLWALEKQQGALRFYERHGFRRTRLRNFEEGTTEYLVLLEREALR